MAIERPINNYTPFPNCILDNLEKYTGSEIKILNLMVRKNLGYQRPNKKFSLNYISRKLNISKPTVISAIDGLLAKDAITIIGITNTKCRLFDINWQEMTVQPKKEGKETLPSEVKKLYLVKDNILKDNTNTFPKAEKVNKISKENLRLPKTSANKLSYSDAREITQNCLDLLFKHILIKSPKVNRDLYYDPKEIFLSEKYIYYFLKGFPKNNFSSLRDWSKSEIVETGLKTEKKFMEFFESAVKIYLYSYKPENKKILPNRLSSFLYDQFRKAKSYFLFYGLNPPKKISVERTLEDKYPAITEKYIRFFGEVDDMNFLIKSVKAIVNEHTDINKREVENNKREDIENVSYMSHFYNLNEFIDQHIRFLNRFEYSKKFKKSITQLGIGSWFWREFVVFYKKEHSIVLYPSDNYLLRKYKEYIK